MSAEVNPEASRLLRVITANAGQIVGFFALCVVIGGGYGIYSWYSAGQLAKARTELGRIEMIDDAAQRLSALEEFVAGAPGETRIAANLALALAAQDAGEYDRAVTAWAAVAAAEQGSFLTVAVVGQAEALVRAGRDAEALAFLQQHRNSGSDLARTMIDRLVLDLAEKTQQYGAAIAACDALAANPASGGEAEYWRQKAAALRAAEQPS
jgi:lipopolysaccharide biosynthesis regulator YciM